MMTQPYKVIEEIRIKTKAGEMTIAPGKVIKLAPCNALRLIQGGKLQVISDDVLEVISQKQPTSYKPKRGKKEIKWKNPFPQGAPEARQQSLQEIMDAIILQAIDEIGAVCKDNQFRSSDKIRQEEDKVTAIYKKVLGGESTLDEFKKAANQWKELSSTDNVIKKN